jgi:quinol monooxygenase YgiN
LSTCSIGRVLVVNRFRADPDDAAFRADLEDALVLLSGREGFLDGSLGRNVDEPDLWVLVTRWRDVGSYRRALSSYDVKAGAVPVLSRAIDEPSAYEIVEGDLNVAVPRSLG